MRRPAATTCAAFLLLTAAARADLVREGPEFQVNTFTPREQRRPGVAMSPAGDFVVVWESGSYYDPWPDGSASGVFSQRYDSAGAPVASEFQVNTYTTGYQFDPTIALSPAGRFVISWSSGYYSAYYSPPGQDGSEFGAFVQPFAPDGTPVGLELQANTYTTSRQHRTDVGTDAAGNFVVVWQSSSYSSPGGQDGSVAGVFAQRFSSNGTPLDPEFQVNVFTTGSQSSPAVAVEPSGSFVVVWQSGYYGYQDGSYTGVFGRRFASTGAPLGAEFQVNTYTTGHQFAPAVALAPGGGFVVVWTSESYYSVDQDGSRSGVFGRRFDATGAPLGGEFQANTYTTDDQFAPVVAADAGGQFVVAWNSYYQDGSGTGVFAQLFSSLGVKEGPEFQVNTVTAGYQSEAAVAGGPVGHFVVAWSSAYPPDVFAQRLRVAGPLRALAGSVLRLEDDAGDPNARRLLVRSTDAGITLGGGDGSTDDPTLSGGQLRVRSATFDDTYDLPAANWQTIGLPGANAGYRYRDPSLAAGPALRVKVKPGRLLRIVARGAALGHTLGANPDPVTVVLQTGALGHRHCMTFGGAARFTPGERFRALGAPAACPP